MDSPASQCSQEELAAKAGNINFALGKMMVRFIILNLYLLYFSKLHHPMYIVMPIFQQVTANEWPRKFRGLYP